MLLSTERLRYLDLTNYLAAGTSLDAFYKAYNVSAPKGNFPYQWFDSLEKLDYPRLPEQKLFYTTLKKKGIEDTDYKDSEQIWLKENMTTFRDYIRYYNNHDVIGMIEGIEKMLKIENANKLDVFKESVSLPGLTQTYLFKKLGDDYFTNFSKEHGHIYKELRQGIVGGPSIVFCRYQEAGITKIKGKNICRKIIGYDANALYLDCSGKRMPTGRYVVRTKKDNFKRDIKFSKSSIEWLEYIMKTQGIHIRHAANSVHGEKRIENFSVDGFCEETNTVYEFLGCYYHGHCKYYDAKKWKDTRLRIETIKQLGYKMETITECQFKQCNIDINVDTTVPTCTKDDIQDAIMTGESFGFVKCSISVPEGEREKGFFSQFPPIFKNTEITMNDVGEHMQEYARSIGRQKGVEKSLISSMHGDGIVILTPLFEKYIQMGLECTDIEWIIEYNPKKVFEWFRD